MAADDRAMLAVGRAQRALMPDARERVLSTAYSLFTRRGIRDVGIDEIIARSQVAKASFYRHFPSKTDLILAVLDRREQVWTIGLVEEQSRLRGNTPEDQLLAIFDVFHDWFARSEDFDGCSFINILLEMGAEHPAGKACIDHLANVRSILRERASKAGLRDPEEFAWSFHVLMKGAIIVAAEGDPLAARRAKVMARTLIESHRKTA